MKLGLWVALALIAAACSNGTDPSPSTTSFTATVPLVSSSTSMPGVSTTSSPTTSAVAVPADGPSQTPDDAGRDGVVQAIADLTPQKRVQPLLTVEAEEGLWVLSALTDEVVNASFDDGCVLGDPAGQYGVDFVCSVEYGEIVLADDRGEIVKAYPMPGAKPSWMHVTDSWVYAGRIGDGGLPDATIVRIDRADLSAVVVVMPAPTDGGSSWPPGWFVASEDQMEQSGRLVGQRGDMDGLLVESWIGEVIVDLDAIDAFLEQFVAHG